MSEAQTLTALCAQCGARLRVKTHKPEKAIACPKCGAEVIAKSGQSSATACDVPREVEAEPREFQAEPNQANSADPRRRPSRRHWIAGIAGASILLPGGVVLTFLYPQRPKVLECGVNELIVQDRDGRITSSKKTILVKICADKDSTLDKEDFVLIIPDGRKIMSDHVLLLGPGKMGMLDPNDDYSEEYRAIINFKLPDDVAKDVALKFKYKRYPASSLPDTRKQIQSTLRFD